MLEEPLRRFLSGELRNALLKLLDEVIENPGLELYAALFELADEELISRLILLRERAHIILANGAGGGDENEAARKRLRKNKVDVFDRMLKSGRLGHNKFALVYDTQAGRATKVWTGSANWAATGLCTQLNNGILIEDGAVAEVFSRQWDLLQEAVDGFPSALMAQNNNSPQRIGNVDVWFSPVNRKATDDPTLNYDLAALKEIVSTAQEMVLYVMFQPGAEPLQTILQLDDRVIVKGTVSTLLPSNVEKFELNGIESKSYREKLVVPDGIHESFSTWVREVTRGGFRQIGHAITHSKMIVIDPLSDNCKVITGSYNFSSSASGKNDENFLVIEGNKELAAAYAVACLGTYAHYRWRAHVKENKAAGRKVWSHLASDDSWQRGCLSPDVVRTLAYWVKG